jgi:hypothetical protein
MASRIQPLLTAVAVAMFVLPGCTPAPIVEVTTDTSTATGTEATTSADLGSQWSSADHGPVDADLLAVEEGPEHCDWNDTVFLLAEWSELGVTLEAPNVVSGFYVRDPASVDLTGDAVHEAGYSSDADLPPAAIDIGYRSGDVELFVSPDGSVVYLVGGDRVERWPALQGGCA